MAQTPQAPPDPPRKHGLRPWLVQLVLPLGVGAALLLAVVLIGAKVRERQRQDGSKSIAFTDIECDPPEGLSRQDFLEQAQYLANFPDRINLLEEDISARIAEALSEHPLVEKVQRVEQLPGGRLSAQIVFRVAVLSVADPEAVVDRHGIILAASAERKDLPVLQAQVTFPTAGPGHPWEDETVKAAASIAGVLQPHLRTLKLQGCIVVLKNGDFVLRTTGTKVIWGRPPGRERPQEPSAEQKLQRLLDRPELDGQEHDLRGAECVRRRLPSP